MSAQQAMQTRAAERIAGACPGRREIVRMGRGFLRRPASRTWSARAARRVSLGAGAGADCAGGYDVGPGDMAGADQPDAADTDRAGFVRVLRALAELSAGVDVAGIFTVGVAASGTVAGYRRAAVAGRAWAGAAAGPPVEVAGNGAHRFPDPDGAATDRGGDHLEGDLHAGHQPAAPHCRCVGDAVPFIDHQREHRVVGDCGGGYVGVVSVHHADGYWRRCRWCRRSRRKRR